MVPITVNAEPRDVPGGCSVAALLRLLGRDPAKLAVEVNERVVPAADHPTCLLSRGDRVEIVTLVGGG